MLQFDNNPSVYWLLGYLFAGAVLLASNSKRVSDNAFLICGLILLIVMRLPGVVLNRELNPDESQMLSHALTLYQDPVYWKSVDGTTIGPLDNYFLVIPRLIGFQVDYTSGRVMGLIATALYLTFLFFALRNWSTGKWVRTLWLAPVLLLAFTQEADFVHYSSEQVPLLLLSGSIWLLSKFTSQRNVRNYYVFSLGFVLGAIPFAKLQVVPLAAVVGIFTLWQCYKQFQKEHTPLPFLTFVVGVLLFPFLFLAWASYNEVLQDFIDFYLRGNAIYAGGNDKSIISQFFNLLGLSKDFMAFAAVLALGSLVAVPAILKKENKTTLPDVFPIALFSFLLFLSSVYSITKSGNDFVHYLNLCIIPVTLLTLPAWNRIKSRIVFLVPVCIAGWFFLNDVYLYKTEHILNRFVSVGMRSLNQSPVIVELKKYARPRDYMAVWGWQCTYYVEAQLAQGTAENHSERCIFPHEMRQKYRDRYMSDITRTQPAIIIDAVGKNSLWVQDNNTQGISSFPELSKFVQDNYNYEGDFDGSKLYVRKDR